jgi:general secretion pathway protein J
MSPRAEIQIKIQKARGVTLLEVLVSLSILAVISTLIYGAFDGMSRTQKGLGHMNERYHQGRSALSRFSREIQSAFLSMHHPFGANLNPGLMTRATVFIGSDSRPSDRIDFTSFSHRRLKGDSHESDQNELSYYDSRDTEKDKLDLVRREDKSIDLEPEKGGVVNVVAEDIESFDLQYFDPISKEWTDSWDSTQPAGQLERLPLYVKAVLVLKGGAGGKPITVQTKVPLGMQMPLMFGLPQQQQGGDR